MAGRKTQPKPGLAALLLRGAVGNPMATAGGLVMTATAVAIMANALMLQPRAHPAPLFVGIRPLAQADRPATPALRSSDGSAVGATDHSLVADIQQGLKDFGYYRGEVDGLDGPQTSQAILAFERAFRLTPTGEPSNNVLLAIRSVRPKTSLNGEAPVAADPLTVASLPTTPAVPAATAVPMPWPKPSAAVAEAAAPQMPAAPIDGIGDLIATAAPAAPATATASVAQPPAPKAAAVAADANLARIQRSLSQQGFGPVAADGVMTAETRDAIRQFQAYYNLPQTGAINEAFLNQLVKVGGL